MKNVPVPVLVYSGLLLYTVLPLLCVLVAGAIANHFGCRLDESGAHPCIVGGSDWGGTLITLAVAGWFMLVTIPTGAIAIILYTVALLIAKASAKRGQINL